MVQPLYLGLSTFRGHSYIKKKNIFNWSQDLFDEPWGFPDGFFDESVMPFLLVCLNFPYATPINGFL